MAGVIGSVGLSTALPLAAASLAYINGRWNVANDVGTLAAVTIGVFGMSLRERRERVNVIYDLEERANDKKDGDRLFLIFEGKSWTYKEAWACVLRYARWLKEDMQIKKGDIVAVDYMNGDTMIWLLFALWSLSAKPALINYNLTGKPLVHSIRESTAHLVLIDPEIKGVFTDEVLEELAKDSFRLSGGPVKTLVLERDLQDQILASTEGWREPDESRSGAKLEDMAMLIFTSGTTGLPKPAIVSWNKLVLGAKFTAGMLPVRKTDILYTCMPLYHSSACILAMDCALQVGATLSLGKRFSARTFWKEVRESKATMVQYVGETLRYLLATPPSPEDSQHSVKLAYGNGLRPDVWPVFQKRFGVPVIAEFYAATEGPGMMWNRSRNDFTRGAVGRTGAVSRLLFGKRSAIVKFDFEENEVIRDPKTGFCIRCEVNEPGELLYRLDENAIGKTFQGYYGNKGATSKKIRRDVLSKGDAFFSTGDVLRMDHEGRCYFVDRIGDTFRWRSENVSTAEVSEVLGKVPGIAEANSYGVLVPKHDGRAGCAAIILNDHGSASTLSTASSSVSPVSTPPENILVALASAAETDLPKYAIPLFLRFTRAMDLTGTNKQQKHTLREQGIRLEQIEKTGDRMYWFKDGRYVPFEKDDLERIESGGAKL